MKLKSLFLFTVLAGVFGANHVLADENLLHKDYIEALVNLQSIEPYFTGQPIYLSKNEELKRKLKTKLERIISTVENYHQQNPRNGEPLLALGKAYSHAHDLDVPGSWAKSVVYLNKALEIDPGNEYTHILQGKNYMDARKFDLALEEYEQAYQINPAGQARLSSAIAKLNMGRPKEAEIDLQEYLRSNSKDDFAQKMLKAIQSGQINYQ